MPFYREQMKIVLRNCGQIDPTSMEEYIARDGYRAIAKVLASMTPEEVIEEVKTLGPAGPGRRPASPPGMKWRFAREVRRRHEVRDLQRRRRRPRGLHGPGVLEGDPHTVIEGMMIAAYAIGADEGYIYVRAEYPDGHRAAEDRHRPGRGAAGCWARTSSARGFNFDLEIKEGAGAFVCGEETALIASIEGQARHAAAPAALSRRERACGASPTNINNVETFANVAAIITDGRRLVRRASARRRARAPRSSPLPARSSNTGLVEVPMGITSARSSSTSAAASRGTRSSRRSRRAARPAAASPQPWLDLPIDYDSLTTAGAIMGSGGMVVMDEDTCMVDMATLLPRLHPGRIVRQVHALPRGHEADAGDPRRGSPRARATMEDMRRC